MENMNKLIGFQLKWVELLKKEKLNIISIEEENEMQDLEIEIVEEIRRISKSEYHVVSIDKNILDIIVSDWSEDALKLGFKLYTYDEYIEAYEVFKTKNEKSLYYFNLENGKDWLITNELNTIEHIAFTRDYIAIAENV